MKPFVGTLLPLWSLRSRLTTDFFEAGEHFVRWLKNTRQRIWQHLPLHATTWVYAHQHFDSPYSCYGVGLNPLLLPPGARDGPFQKAKNRFLEDHAAWIYDYALFVVLSQKMQTDDWRIWPTPYRERHHAALENLKTQLQDQIEHVINQQAHLHEKYFQLRDLAQENGIEMWGDVPFYLPIRSPLTWVHQTCFDINDEWVAGSTSGRDFALRQLWGFPLYAFDKKTAAFDIEQLWFLRMNYVGQLYSRVRLDAAVRFFTYEKMHTRDPNKDYLLPGPGASFFTRLVNHCRSRQFDVYIEDIANIDLRPLQQTANQLNVPGMSVASMMFTHDQDSINPTFFDISQLGKSHIFFTSTADTAPLLSFVRSLTLKQRAIVCKTLGIHAGSVPTIARSIRDLFVQKAQYAIIPLQDWLFLTQRINIPGVNNERNWNYAMQTGVEDLPPLG
jgi:4-alpha-glucanotransferase